MSRIKIGETLASERKKKNYSQAEVATQLACDRAAISRIENGRYQGSLQLLERYVNLMGFELAIRPMITQRPSLDELQGLYDDN